MSKKVSFLFALVFTSMCLLAQTNHPTVQDLKVAYKAVPQSTSNAVLTNIQCIAQASITLKPNVSAAKVYFKVINPQTNTTVYQINYPLSTSAIVDNNGITLFENSNGVIKISSGQVIGLKPYVYEIQTENAQNVLTTVYSVTK